MKRILMLFVTALTFFACTEKEESGADQTGLRITHTNLEFPYSSTSYPVSVMTDRPWSLTSDSEWLNATIDGADYGVSFCVVAEANTGQTTRRGVLTISNDLGSRQIIVLQRADERNFTDIYLTADPSAYERLRDAFLVIPYRHGGGIVLDALSVSVAGSARGTVTVESMENIQLEDGEGEIRMSVNGRVSGAGKLLFTVSGLPPVVFGEATQCMIDVAGTEELADYDISQVRALPLGVISDVCRTKGVVVSQAGSGLPEVGKIVMQDDMAGIVVRLPGDLTLDSGDECEIFLMDAMLTDDDGLLTVVVDNSDDVSVISKGNQIIPKEISAMPFNMFESMLCKVTHVQVASEESGRQGCAGTTRMERYGWSESFYMYIPDSASFAYRELPSGSGTLTGIIGKNEDGSWVICPQENIVSMTSERLNLEAYIMVDKQQLDNIPNEGISGLNFTVTSTGPWTLSSDDDGWIYDWSVVSGTGRGIPQTVYFSVRPNAGARRNATVTLSGAGVPDCKLIVIQIEGARILDADFSMVRQQLQESPKYFPSSASVDYAKSLTSIGLDGWASTNCYASLSPDGEYGLLRIGKTLTRGYIQTPAFRAVGDVPVNVEVNLLAGIFKGCVATWVGLELDGPGTIVTGGDVSCIAGYDDIYTDDLVDKLPFYVLDELSSDELRRVTIRIEGATEDTALRLTATCKGGSSAALCNMFIIGDLHVEYAD